MLFCSEESEPLTAEEVSISHVEWQSNILSLAHNELNKLNSTYKLKHQKQNKIKQVAYRQTSREKQEYYSGKNTGLESGDLV